MNLSAMQSVSVGYNGKKFISYKDYEGNNIKFLNEGVDKYYGVFMFWMQDYNVFSKKVTRKYFFKTQEDYKTEGDVYNPTANKMQHSVVDIKKDSIACYELPERTEDWKLKAFHNKMVTIHSGDIVELFFKNKYNKYIVIEVNKLIPAEKEDIETCVKIAQESEQYRQEYTLDRVIRMGITPREKTYIDANGVERTIMTSYINLAEQTTSINDYYMNVYGAKKIIDGQVQTISTEETDYTPDVNNDTADKTEVESEDVSSDEKMITTTTSEEIDIENIVFEDENPTTTVQPTSNTTNTTSQTTSPVSSLPKTEEAPF